MASAASAVAAIAAAERISTTDNDDAPCGNWALGECSDNEEDILSDSEELVDGILPPDDLGTSDVEVEQHGHADNSDRSSLVNLTALLTGESTSVPRPPTTQ